MISSSCNELDNGNLVPSKCSGYKCSESFHKFASCHQKCRLKEEPLTFGALCVLKHLLPRFLLLHELNTVLTVFCHLMILVQFIWRLSEAWHGKRPSLVEAVKLLLDEHSLGARKALAEVRYLALTKCLLINRADDCQLLTSFWFLIVLLCDS